MIGKRGIYIRIAPIVLVLLSMVTPAGAERILSASAYTDQLKGMWIGELLGNYAGRQVEGATTVLYEGPNPVNKPITDYQVQWNTILTGQYYNSSGVLQGNTSYWVGDDDTCLEFLYAHALQNKASLTTVERTDLWKNEVRESGLYFANRQSWILIKNYGFTATQAGLPQNNHCAHWTIDSQITTEALGAVAPGMRSNASSLAADFGGITNHGFPLYAAQYYAAMYAEAPFATNVENLVARSLEAVPQGSWTRSVIEKAVELYQADKNDNGQLDNWLASRNAALTYALQRGRSSLIWTQSASNTALTTLAILYGQGSFKATVEYGVRGGHDSDCNPATAGGLVGLMKGYDDIVTELAGQGLDTSAIPQSYRPTETIPTLNFPHTLDAITAKFQTAAETQIVATLGTGAITGSGSERQYHLPDSGVGPDAVSPPVCVDPLGPRGLVGDVLADGGNVNVVVTRNGVAQANNPAADRTNQGGLIDGIIDVSCNGVLPFRTYSGTTGPRTDAYELHFNRTVRLESLILHEGDIYPANPSRDPRDPAYVPYGGYFTDLTVEVQRDGLWTGVSNPALSEPLDPFVYFQSITISFDPVIGEAIRVVGSAGGQYPFTSLTELEAFGILPVPGDANIDGQVNLQDLSALAGHYDQASEADWLDGDFNDDGAVNLLDLSFLATNYGTGGSGLANGHNNDRKALGITVASESKEEPAPETGLSCGAVGLPLMAGLLLACLGLGVKIKE